MSHIKERKRYAYRGILHPVSTVNEGSVVEVCVTPTDDLPSRQDSVVDVCVTPCSNISVNKSMDNKLHHQGNCPISNSFVQTPNTLLDDRRCHRKQKTSAVVQCNQENYSRTCVQSKHGLSSQPFEIYVLCDNFRTGIGNALVDTGSQV